MPTQSNSFLLRILLCCTVLDAFVESRITQSIVYDRLPPELLSEARKFGAKAYKNFLYATENATSIERMNVYEDYFMECNTLGHERAQKVFQSTYNTKLTKDMKLLLTLGFNSFAARFVSMEADNFKEGLQQLCEKYEMQLQCQYGFGESRTAIYWRLDDLKNTDGNLRILLDRQCPEPEIDNTVYHCFSSDVEEYTKPCFEQMLAYNYTRYSAGRRIARLHIKATKEVAELTANKDLENDNDQFLSMKEHVQSVFGKALRQIAEIEGEKCEALEKVLKCVMPRVEEKCGSEAVDIMQSSILVGYLSIQRREPLASQFKGFGVESSKKCLKLDPHIE
ncbi:unnamed protein product [Caenorhabditis sp. 36 PRJEB53466]|nr:unnamed protein product [Caenorhabditis sp. 36 PRJEB53466]